jgi:AcrR family transcriptional regulator
MRQAEVQPARETTRSRRGSTAPAVPAPGPAASATPAPATESSAPDQAAGSPPGSSGREPTGSQRDRTAGSSVSGDLGEAQPAAARRPGRPRSERADRAIVEAALELFAEQGAAGLCVEAIAARAGVGKATIYRRWAGKEELLFDALASLKSPLPEPAGVSVRDDLVTMLSVMCNDLADPRRARQYALLLGEGEKYPKLMERYKETVVEPRRDVIRSVLRRGLSTGELRPGADVEVAMLALTGAVLARGKQPGGITADFAKRVVDEHFLGLAPR